jgi:hypothetical protein
MEKDFVPYEESLALKELGFDEFCIGNYADDKKHTLFTDKGRRGKVDAPTFSQAFRWFRENHSLFPYVEYLLEEKFDYVIVSKMYDKPVDYLDGKFDTYEEAELACLKKLIEIKNEQQ